MELCEALRRSVAALRREKEALSEEQRGHQELAAGVQSLVQERLKASERDKYAGSIGTSGAIDTPELRRGSGA